MSARRRRVVALAVTAMVAAGSAHAISGGDAVATILGSGGNGRASVDRVAVARSVAATTVALVLFNGQGQPDGLCSGSIVHERVILTAGHCVVAGGGVRRLAVLFEDGVGGTARREALDIEVHPAFLDLVQGAGFRRDSQNLEQQLRRNGGFFAVDLALVLLHRPVPDTHRPALQVAPGYRDRAGGAKVIAGFGAERGFAATGTPALRYAEVVGASLRADRGEVTGQDELVLDSKYRNGARVTTCKGDSGGPIFVRESGTGRLRLVGVSSAGDEHCREVAVAASIAGQRAVLRRMFDALMQGEQGAEGNPF